MGMEEPSIASKLQTEGYWNPQQCSITQRITDTPRDNEWRPREWRLPDSIGELEEQMSLCTLGTWLLATQIQTRNMLIWDTQVTVDINGSDTTWTVETTNILGFKAIALTQTQTNLRPLSEPQGSPPRSETCRIRLPGNRPLTRKRYTSLTWPTKNDWVGMLSYWPVDLKQVWTAQIPTQNLMEDVAEITVLVNLENGRWLCGITWNSKTSKDDWGHTQCNFILKHEQNQWKAKVAFQDHWSGQKNFKMHWEITFFLKGKGRPGLALPESYSVVPMQPLSPEQKTTQTTGSH